MGKTVEITCDGCGHDLTTRSNSVDYRLVLAAESKPGYGAGVYTDMMIYPPVERTYYFCGLECLDRWRGRELHKASSWREWNEKWKQEHGTRHQHTFGGDGFIWSCPCPPEDVRKERDAEFEAAALTAFPMKETAR